MLIKIKCDKKAPFKWHEMEPIPDTINEVKNLRLDKL